MTLVRRWTAFALSAAALISLTGCTQIPASAGPDGSCTPPSLPGAAADAIGSDGAFGERLDIQLAAPVSTHTMQLARAGAGSGNFATESGVLEARFTVASAIDGSPIIEYGDFASTPEGEPVPMTMAALTAQLPGAAAVLQCAQAGERLVSAMPANELFGDIGTMAGSANSTVIFAADVTRVYPSSAAGVIAPPQDGIPAVVTAPNGRPGVTMPNQPAPTEARHALRVRGFGEPITDGEKLTVHVSIFDWESGTEIASSWDASNSVMQLTATADPNGDDGLYGVTSQLIGQPGGSQLVTVVPTEQALSRRGPLSPSLATGRTLVLVVDVLASDEVETK